MPVDSLQKQESRPKALSPAVRWAADPRPPGALISAGAGGAADARCLLRRAGLKDEPPRCRRAAR